MNEKPRPHEIEICKQCQRQSVLLFFGFCCDECFDKYHGDDYKRRDRWWYTLVVIGVIAVFLAFFLNSANAQEKPQYIICYNIAETMALVDIAVEGTAEQQEALVISFAKQGGCFLSNVYRPSLPTSTYDMEYWRRGKDGLVYGVISITNDGKTRFYAFVSATVIPNEVEV